MRIDWRSSKAEEVTEIDAAGNPVQSSLTPEQDMALRTAALGVCEYCGGPLTEIWQARWSRTSTIQSSGDHVLLSSGNASVTVHAGFGRRPNVPATARTR